MDSIKQTDNLQMNMNRRGRGRPRKNQSITPDKIKQEKTYKINKFISIKKEADEDIFLHLPVSFKDLEDFNKNISNDQNTSEYKNNDINKSETSKTESNNDNKNVFMIDDIHSENNDDSDYLSDDILVQELKDKIKEQEKTIKSLEDELENYKSLLNNDSMVGTNNRKVTKMELNFINSIDGKQILSESTNLACWWCTYNFNTPPCFLPEKIYDNKYHVFGCFCSANCAAAYNLKTDDANIWTRYSLLKKVYNKLYDNNNEITPAPPREVFTKFGGTLTYEEYVKNCVKCTKEYRFIMPPMTSITPLIEEANIDQTKVSVSLADLNKRKGFHRNKPLPNVKNTLFETFGLTK